MNGFIRKFNQNRKMIFLDVFIIVSVIICIQVVNNVLKDKHKNEYENIVNTQQDISSYNSRQSVVTGETVDTKKHENNSQIIENFIKYCNDKNPQKAYELLSEACKAKMFPTENDFINQYYLIFFKDQQEYNYESWLTKSGKYTYKVDLYEDMLKTGGQNTSVTEEYYTVVTENNSTKLNINGFVNSTKMNKNKGNSNITVTIKEKNTFMEYETYVIEVKNNTNKDILLDSKESTNTMYIQDKKENKYSSYSHEISYDKLWVKPNMTRTIEIKFTKEYSSQLDAEKLVFSDIILDYNTYKNLNDKKQYTNRYNLEIDF